MVKCLGNGPERLNLGNSSPSLSEVGIMKPVTVSAAALVCVFLVSAASADVFNMGGVRNPDGSWTGLASLETVHVGNPGSCIHWSL